MAPSLYSDVLQYVPAWNRIDSWQLYSGPGYTAGSVIPVDRWFHVRIEVAGTRMRVFIDNRPGPELEVPQLQHGRGKGGIMLNGPADGSAYYSHFSYREDDRLDLGPARRSNEPVGFIKKWQVSQSFPSLKIDESGPGLPVPLGSSNGGTSRPMTREDWTSAASRGEAASPTPFSCGPCFQPERMKSGPSGSDIATTPSSSLTDRRSFRETAPTRAAIPLF